jgi:hypothetical protein
MSKHAKIPTTDVLSWLKANHPALHAVAEVDRNWVWIAADLRKDEAARTSIKEYGFRFARRGGHPLPSGAMGTWAHSCDRPTPGKFKRKQQPGQPASQPKPEAEAEQTEELLDELAAFAGL